MNGIVKFYDAQKGYGFVTPLAGGGSGTAAIYFHVSAIARPENGLLPGIPSGAEIRFDLVRGDRGPQCANVRVVTLSGAILSRSKAIKTRSAENVVSFLQHS